MNRIGSIAFVCFVFLCAHLSFSADTESTEGSDGFAGGSGTQKNPYLVENAEQLNNVRNKLSSHFKQIHDIDLSVYSGDEGWEPIGFFNPWGSSKGFTGTFNGNGYHIKNLTIENTKSLVTGLFEYLDGDSTLKNIDLRRVQITGKGGAAGLVGANGSRFSDSTPLVTNCSVQGNVTGKEGATGGVIAGNYGQIKNSYFVGEIEGESPVGGLAGGNDNGEITTSYAEGEVQGQENTGGLVGNNKQGQVTDSYFSGEVTGKTFSVGGVAGQNLGRIKDCYAMGEIAGKKRIAGVAGWNKGYIGNSYSGCAVRGEKNTSGLVGKNNGDIVNSYYDTTIASQNDTDNGMPKMTEEMMHRGTFEEWDFEETWAIDEGKSYPYLQWEEGRQTD